jgi:NAD(P)-dependent dehydrogenase (short-subunit alcohol dehydrogenase family)
MKRILCIGGSTGIGAALVKKLADNHQIIIASRTPPSFSHENVQHLVYDVTQPQPEQLTAIGPIDKFVYFPGNINLKPLSMLKLEHFKEEMQLNFFGLVETVKTIYAQMNEGSSMVFFSTVAVQTGMPFHSSIASAKGAIEGFTRALAAEAAPKIRVNAIAPSIVDTPLASRLLNNEKKVEMIAERHPLKRIGNAEELANAVAFLLDEKNSWITGQVLAIDGGKSSISL